jgi:t-SNARE complex subunit (syntaxin)
MEPVIVGLAASLLGAVLSGGLNSLLARIAPLYPFVSGPAEEAAAQAEQTLESRLAELGKTMSDASQLMLLVETEIKGRQEQIAQLADKVKQQEELAALTSQAKDAVAAVLRTEIVREGRRAKWQAFWIGFAFFLLGSVVTFLVTYYVHPAWG